MTRAIGPHTRRFRGDQDKARARHNFATKMLGILERRMRSTGQNSGVWRRRMVDGSVIEVTSLLSAVGQPMRYVRVWSPEATESPTPASVILLLESGLVDLHDLTTTAPASVYYGANSGSVPQGEIDVPENMADWGNLPAPPADPYSSSVLVDEATKRPPGEGSPSLFTGRMRFAMQCWYGSGNPPTVLTAGGIPSISKDGESLGWRDIGHTSGLIYSEGRHYLVQIQSQQVKIYGTERTADADAIADFLVNNGGSLTQAEREACEGYILGQTTLTGTLEHYQDISSLYAYGDPHAYGWHFSWTGTSAACVVHQHSSTYPLGHAQARYEARLLQISITHGGGTSWSVSTSVGDPEEWQIWYGLLEIAWPNPATGGHEFLLPYSGTAPAYFDFDSSMTCCYVGDTLLTRKLRFVADTNAIRSGFEGGWAKCGPGTVERWYWGGSTTATEYEFGFHDEHDDFDSTLAIESFPSVAHWFGMAADSATWSWEVIGTPSGSWCMNDRAEPPPECPITYKNWYRRHVGPGDAWVNYTSRQESQTQLLLYPYDDADAVYVGRYGAHQASTSGDHYYCGTMVVAVDEAASCPSDTAPWLDGAVYDQPIQWEIGDVTSGTRGIIARVNGGCGYHESVNGSLDVQRLEIWHWGDAGELVYSDEAQTVTGDGDVLQAPGSSRWTSYATSGADGTLAWNGWQEFFTVVLASPYTVGAVKARGSAVDGESVAYRAPDGGMAWASDGYSSLRDGDTALTIGPNLVWTGRA